MGRVGVVVVIVAAIACAVAAAATRRAPTDPGWTEAYPSWSPDGSRILFSRQWSPPKDPGDYRNALVGADGRSYRVLSRPRPPADNPYEVWDLGAHWSPDGKRLLVTRRLGLNDDVIYVKDVATGVERRLTRPGVHERGAGWSSDGARIAFVRENKTTNEEAVYTARADGRDERRVTGGGDITGASWIHAGDSILVSRYQYEAQSVSIVPAAGGGERRLTPAGRWHASGVTADGTRLLLIRDGGDAKEAVWVIGTDGRGLRRLAAGHSARWSPDGRRIAIVRENRTQSTSAILVMNDDGSGVRRLHAGADPAWSPDGRRIAFSFAGECEGTGIFVIDARGGRLARLTNSCRLVGTPRADLLLGSNGRDVIRALGGNDTVRANPGNARSVYYGWGDADDVDGGSGRDTIIGARDRDVLRGGRGNDRLYGGDGGDRLFGGADDDLLVGGRGRDRLDCGHGRDIAVVDKLDVVRGCERVRS